MKPRAVALIFVAATAWAQIAPSLVHATTDERVKACETMLRKSPDDPHLMSELVSAYLQKLRETADYRYLDRASQLVDRLLERDGGNFEALRFENEIDLQRHDFRAVAERSRDMIRYNPSD